MKVIFLDFDGVLNSYESIHRGACQNGMLQVDPWHVAHLNEIIERTGANVVVSSTWRLRNNTENLQKILNAAGFKGKVIGQTTSVWDRRGNQIQEWLDGQVEKPEVFVILDDDSDMEHLMNRLFQTVGRKGLLAEHIEPVVEMLKV